MSNVFVFSGRLAMTSRDRCQKRVNRWNCLRLALASEDVSDRERTFSMLKKKKNLGNWFQIKVQFEQSVKIKTKWLVLLNWVIKYWKPHHTCMLTNIIKQTIVVTCCLRRFACSASRRGGKRISGEPSAASVRGRSKVSQSWSVEGRSAARCTRSRFCPEWEAGRSSETEF